MRGFKRAETKRLGCYFGTMPFSSRVPRRSSVFTAQRISFSAEMWWLDRGQQRCRPGTEGVGITRNGSQCVLLNIFTFLLVSCSLFHRWWMIIMTSHGNMANKHSRSLPFAGEVMGSYFYKAADFSPTGNSCVVRVTQHVALCLHWQHSSQS